MKNLMNELHSCKMATVLNTRTSQLFYVFPKLQVIYLVCLMLIALFYRLIAGKNCWR